ncbi:MAG: ATP synthase F1 subunit epsilon [Acidobacteria bacterium]|nr:ATP synthase F1 subunit epsilon [Acidobacteriota bacterium]
MASLKVEIVTPEAALWTGEAKGLMARSSEGEFTILPQHTSTVGDIVPGLVRVATSSGEVGFCVHGGFFQVGPDEEDGVTRATVLAGIAERVSDIDVSRAQAAQEAAEAQLSSGADLDEAARSLAAGALARAQLRLRLAAAR